LDFKDGGRLKIYLVRHGQTTWSLSGQHTGATDIPLTAHGEEEARRLRPRLDPIPFTHVFSSPRARALRTCELACAAMPTEVEPDLAEWNYGEYEGLRGAEILARKPGWDIFNDGCPGGESPAHGHFSRVLTTRWLDAPIAFGKHLSLATGSLSVLGFDPHHPENAVLELWNATS
jgi:broad specificity phosphatase PhoE